MGHRINKHCVDQLKRRSHNARAESFPHVGPFRPAGVTDLLRHHDHGAASGVGDAAGRMSQADRYVRRHRGNFLDTANIYQSEEVVGDCLEGRRDKFVVSTKFTFGMDKENANYGGNNRKSMALAVEDSLRKLKTDYINLYYMHFWEFRTPVEELMRGLDDLVTSGKVLYLAASNFPAWKVSEANTIADLRGWNRFVGMQARYSMVERAVERDIVPMAADMGLTILPWGPLCSGVLTGKYKPEDRVEPDADVPPDGTRRSQVVKTSLSDRNLAIAAEVQKVAGEVDATPLRSHCDGLCKSRGGRCL